MGGWGNLADVRVNTYCGVITETYVPYTLYLIDIANSEMEVGWSPTVLESHFLRPTHNTPESTIQSHMHSMIPCW